MLATDTRRTVGDGLRSDRIDSGLTPSQKAYCRARASGLGPSDAYRRAYNCEGSSPGTINGNSQTLENSRMIVDYTNGLLDEAKRQTSLAPPVEREERIEITRDWVGQGIAKIATNPAVKPNIRLQAYVHAGKLAGVDAFREIVVHQKTTRTLEEIDQEIARHLANMIDVTPNAPGSSLPVIEQEAKPTAARDRRRKPTT